MTVLPEDFVQSISDMEQKTKVMSSAEIKRSTKADELVIMVCDSIDLFLMREDGRRFY